MDNSSESGDQGAKPNNDNPRTTNSSEATSVFQVSPGNSTSDQLTGQPRPNQSTHTIPRIEVQGEEELADEVQSPLLNTAQRIRLRLLSNLARTRAAAVNECGAAQKRTRPSEDTDTNKSKDDSEEDESKTKKAKYPWQTKNSRKHQSFDDGYSSQSSFSKSNDGDSSVSSQSLENETSDPQLKRKADDDPLEGRRAKSKYSTHCDSPTSEVKSLECVNNTVEICDTDPHKGVKHCSVNERENSNDKVESNKLFKDSNECLPDKPESHRSKKDDEHLQTKSDKICENKGAGDSLSQKDINIDKTDSTKDGKQNDDSNTEKSSNKHETSETQTHPRDGSDSEDSDSPEGEDNRISMGRYTYDPSTNQLLQDGEPVQEAGVRLTYLQRWQNQHVAKSIVDNAINKTLEELGLSPNPNPPPSQLQNQTRQVENEGVSAAIESRGLRRPSQDETTLRPPTLLGSGDRLRRLGPIIARLTQVSENIFAQNMYVINPRNASVTHSSSTEQSETGAEEPGSGSAEADAQSTRGTDTDETNKPLAEKPGTAPVGIPYTDSSEDEDDKNESGKDDSQNRISITELRERGEPNQPFVDMTSVNYLKALTPSSLNINARVQAIPDSTTGGSNSEATAVVGAATTSNAPVRPDEASTVSQSNRNPGPDVDDSVSSTSNERHSTRTSKNSSNDSNPKKHYKDSVTKISDNGSNVQTINTDETNGAIPAAENSDSIRKHQTTKTDSKGGEADTDTQCVEKDPNQCSNPRPGVTPTNHSVDSVEQPHSASMDAQLIQSVTDARCHRLVLALNGSTDMLESLSDNDEEQIASEPCLPPPSPSDVLDHALNAVISEKGLKLI